MLALNRLLFFEKFQGRKKYFLGQHQAFIAFHFKGSYDH